MKNQVKLLLVYPPITRYERYSSSIGASGGHQIPLGIFYLAAYVRLQGYDVSVIDAEADNLSARKITEMIEALNFNVLGISSTTVAFHRSLELAETAKKRFPDMPIIIGGPHVSSQPCHPLEFLAFDFGVRNEGELTLVELLNALERDRDFEQIPGLIFRYENRIQVNPQRPYIRKIDTIPFPAYDLISDLKKYTPPPSNFKKMPVANIITSRGCPYQCTFCDNNTFGRKTRLRSADNIAAEIEMLCRRYGVREIAFVDDTFTVNKKRIYQLFHEIQRKKLYFPWTCMARIDTVDADLLTFMRNNGCWHISFGIESGSQKILHLIKKKIDLEQTENVIEICHKLGILTKGFFMMGHPAETNETLDQTIDFAVKLKLDDIVVTINTPMPGSEQFKDAEKYGSIDMTDWGKFNYWNPVFVPEGLTRGILLKKHQLIYRKFYLRPRILWRYFLSFLSKEGITRFFKILLASRFLFQSRKTRH